MIKTFLDLEVFKTSYAIAMEIYELSRGFPKEERYSLIDQLVRSSRSIAANIAEGWGKRSYENEFKKHLIYSMGSLEETKAWLLFSKDCGYLDKEAFHALCEQCDAIGSMIYRLCEKWKSY